MLAAYADGRQDGGRLRYICVARETKRRIQLSGAYFIKLSCSQTNAGGHFDALAKSMKHPTHSGQARVPEAEVCRLLFAGVASLLQC